VSGAWIAQSVQRRVTRSMIRNRCRILGRGEKEFFSLLPNVQTGAEGYSPYGESDGSKVRLSLSRPVVNNGGATMLSLGYTS
jgi:hypothetical protein